MTEGGNVAIGRGLNFHVKVYILVLVKLRRANISISVPQTPSLDISVQ